MPCALAGNRASTAEKKWTVWFTEMSKEWTSAYLIFTSVFPAGSGLNESGFKVVATDHCGKSAIAIANPGGHLVMADGNTARHYGYANNPGAYFHRAILSLLQ